ncbi:unnamed protein product [Musa acuminata subsp. burmannicoides]
MSLWDMVLQKRGDCGSSGYQAPVMPHFPRSAKGKRSVRKKVEDNQMCAFDLLATVAGNLLSERENSLTPCNDTGTSNTVAVKDTVTQDQLDKEKPCKLEAFDWLRCSEDLSGPENDLKMQIKHDIRENTSKATSSDPASLCVKSDISDEDPISGESKFFGASGKIGHAVDTVAERYAMGRPYSSPAGSLECKEDGSKTPQQAERLVAGNAVDGNAPHTYSLNDAMDLDGKTPALVSSDSSFEVPLYRKNTPCNSSFPKQDECMDLPIDKDGDENSSGCTHPTIVTNKASRLQRIGDRRIRKLLASKFWKVSPTMLQDDVDQKPALRGKRMCYTRQRTQRSSFKRRKLFYNCSVSASDGGIYSEGVSNICEKGRIKLETNDLHATWFGANSAPSSTTGQKPCCELPDYHVKLSIKSFKVPELLIEIPETATVGSLKRTVSEAVTAILGGGLRIGVLLQGKKVRHDNKTLRQAGISQGDKLDNLGFTLEPNPGQAPAPLTGSEDPHFLGLGCAPEPLPLARIPPTAPATTDQRVSDASPQPMTTCPESDHDSVYSPADASSPEKTTANSLALVAVPPMNVEALAMVPLRSKPKRPEAAQRRVRRPFSVAEVEALVQAVEKLGTGRWRDVKLCAFENANHRTYVDLKDKWKTLVHTARISPQQRRGEPVPQELLDRVLTAHSYWSQHQAKLQLKPPPSAEICQLL